MYELCEVYNVLRELQDFRDNRSCSRPKLLPKVVIVGVASNINTERLSLMQHKLHSSQLLEQLKPPCRGIPQPCTFKNPATALRGSSRVASET